MKVALKDQSGSFHDPATGWSLTRDEVADWPDNAGALTLEFKQRGHIVAVQESQPQKKVEKKEEKK